MISNNKKRLKTTGRIFCVNLVALLLVGCSDTMERVKRINGNPQFSTIEIPNIEQDAEEIERSKVDAEQRRSHQRRTNSLWQPGSTTFFRDSRAWKMGDLIRIKVQIQDAASLNNSTSQRRASSDSMGIPNLFGKEADIISNISPNALPSSLISTNSNKSHNGNGNISRSEVVNTEIAATVSKVLPNGNLVIYGRQEVRVNAELREIKVAGIIRPKDIATDNSIQTNQMAEARISYGGRGVVSDMQHARYGSQLIDIVSPF